MEKSQIAMGLTPAELIISALVLIIGVMILITYILINIIFADEYKEQRRKKAKRYPSKD